MSSLEQGAPGRTLSERIMDEIGRRIVAGGYRPGETLPPEAALCSHYQVSRTPLREAVKRLHAKGLLTVGPRAGTRVREESAWNQFDPDLLRWRFAAGADPDLIVHLYELRLALEPEACRLAALHGRMQDHAEIDRWVGRTEEFRADLDETVEADVAFHMAIVAATRNPFLISIAAAVRLLLSFSFAIRAGRTGTPIPAAELAQHRRIADAVLARDGPGAADAMRALLSESQRTLLAALSSNRTTTEPT